MKKIDFYQITDGQTGAQVAAGLQSNFNALEEAINETENALQPINPIQMDPNSGIINSEADYNAILPTSYLEQYPWKAEYADGLPWLWINTKALIAKGTQICIKHKNAFCKFANIPESIGTVSEDKTVLTLEDTNEYVGFEVQKDLGVEQADIAGIYQVYVLGGANNSVVQEIVFSCEV